MQYDVRIERRSRLVEVSRKDTSSGSESYSVTVHHQSRKKEANLEILERHPDTLVVAIEDKVYKITQLKRSPVSVSFVANGRLQIANLKTRFDEESSLLAPPVSEYVTSTLPAKVVKVSVKTGDALKQADEMLVMESMKMEVQILAPRECKVREVYVKEGESVEKGKKLIWLDFSKDQ